jgi:hypothetical protein
LAVFLSVDRDTVRAAIIAARLLISRRINRRSSGERIS